MPVTSLGRPLSSRFFSVSGITNGSLSPGGLTARAQPRPDQEICSDVSAPITRLAEDLKVPEVWIGSRRYATKKARQKAVQANPGPLRPRAGRRPEGRRPAATGPAGHAPRRGGQGRPGGRPFPDHPYPARSPHHKGPEAVLVDGGKVAFSYQKCLDAPTHRQRVLAAMRTEIQPQVNTYYESRKASHTLVSDESGQPLAPDDTHVSYFRGPRFHDISMEFVQAMRRLRRRRPDL